MSESKPTDEATWRERADELEAHGVPPRRAEVAAYLAGHPDETYEDVAEALGFADRSTVGHHVAAYREDVANSKWLAEHGPEI